MAELDTAMPAYKSTMCPFTPNSSTNKDIKGMTKERLAPTKKLPSQAIHKLCFQLM